MGWGGLGVIIETNLNRVRLSCCWVGVGLGCDNYCVDRCALECISLCYQLPEGGAPWRGARNCRDD